MAGRPDPHDLIVGNLPLAHKIAYDYLARAPRHTDRDDVISAALLGLVEAADRYNPHTGVPFGAWAPARIYGAVIDAARNADPLSRRTRDNVRNLQRVEDQLVVENGTHPADTDLAHRSGLSVDRVRKLRSDLHAGVVLSLDETLPGGDDTFTLQLVDADPTPLEALERREVDAYLADAVASLPERLREVVVSYFHRGETNAQISERLGVTPQRVSQLRIEALRMLRGGLDTAYPSGDAQVAQPGTGRTLSAAVSYAAAVAARRTYAQRLSP